MGQILAETSNVKLLYIYFRQIANNKVKLFYVCIQLHMFLYTVLQCFTDFMQIFYAF